MESEQLDLEKYVWTIPLVVTHPINPENVTCLTVTEFKFLPQAAARYFIFIHVYRKEAMQF